MDEETQVLNILMAKQSMENQPPSPMHSNCSKEHLMDDENSMLEAVDEDKGNRRRKNANFDCILAVA